MTSSALVIVPFSRASAISSIGALTRSSFNMIDGYLGLAVFQLGIFLHKDVSRVRILQG